VLDDLRHNYPELVDDAPRMLQSIAAKSGRYVAEMREVAATQEQAGLTPDLFAALATVFLQLSETKRLAPEQVDPSAALEDVLASIDGVIDRV
jgi:hypothetical protein